MKFQFTHFRRAKIFTFFLSRDAAIFLLMREMQIIDLLLMRAGNKTTDKRIFGTHCGKLPLRKVSSYKDEIYVHARSIKHIESKKQKKFKNASLVRNEIKEEKFFFI